MDDRYHGRLWQDVTTVATGAAISALIAWVDLALPGAFAVAMLHAAVPLFGLALRRATITFGLAAFASVLLLAVPMASGVGHADMAAVVNRALALAAIWAVASLIVYLRRRVRADWRLTTFLDRDEIFQAVFNQTFQLVAALDLDGKIVEANQTLCDFVGLSASEVHGMALWDLPLFRSDPGTRVALRRACADAATGNFVRSEYLVSSLGGDEAAIDLSLKPTRDESSTIHHIIMEARDVTETHIQQQMLVQAQKMEAVGELTAGIAHDFNNLLTVIGGNLELVERRVRGNSAAVDRLRRAVDASFRAQSLTQQLLAFSRRQALHPEIIDINDLLREMQEIYAALGDDVWVEFDLADPIPPCFVDPSQLKNAVLNIAINARDAMPEGGALLFATRQVSIGGENDDGTVNLPNGEFICLSVTDTGNGIPEDVVPRVFTPFFTTKGEGRGSGLGLSMVYGFVKQSGGDVRIESELAIGTTVRLYLPVSNDLPGRVLLPDSGQEASRGAFAGAAMAAARGEPAESNAREN